MDRMPAGGVSAAGAPWLRGFRYKPQHARFSPVQWLIAQLVACGLSDKEIAHLLSISASTVKAHNNKTMRALGLMRRGQLVRYIFETGQFAPEEAERLLSARLGGASAKLKAPRGP
jgi:DNA-binding CsgD family transcriptional regulator